MAEQLEICRRRLLEVASLDTRDLRAEARKVAQQCRGALNEQDRSTLRSELASELEGSRNRIVPGAQMDDHSRRLAVLEAAIEVLTE